MLSLDIIGHEYTHGVINYATGGLSYSGETGAIEEGLVDVFGALVQTFVEGYDHDRTYTMGEDVFLVNDYKRSLSNPKSLGLHSTDAACSIWVIGQPDTYLGQYWDTRGCDLSGVHTNNSIMSHWFYLLAEGGSGNNDNGVNYNVSGIGRDPAAMIAYFFITNYLEYGTNYADARNGTLMATANLFGVCSNPFKQVVNAWQAVGVSSDFPISITNITNPCDAITLFTLLGVPYNGTSLDYIDINCDLSGWDYPVVNLKAVNKITLNPGFHIKDGEFKAEIIECSVAPTLKSIYSRESIYGKGNKPIDILDQNQLDQNDQKSNVILFPNPTTGFLTFKLKANTPTEIKIYNSLGILILNKNSQESFVEFDLSNQPNGIYFAVIKIQNTVINKKIMKN
jgi:hypothetical protein